MTEQEHGGGVISRVYTLERQAELTGLICESFALQVPAPPLPSPPSRG